MSVTFLGASIVQFSANVGWNNEVSRLNVTLVEDDAQDDNFSPPEVGTPVYFDFEGWAFGGLLEKWSRNASLSGNIIEVSVVDARELLSGVQVILDNYYGSVNSVPNIVNVFGYLENTYGFGGSGRNDSGIPWLGVVSAIIALVDGLVNNLYGGHIVYKGIPFGLDLTGLPFVPPAFRVGGTPVMSLMDVLTEICEAAGCEMFFTLEQSALGINFIRLFTINRANIPSIGMINQFVAQTDGAVSKEVGLEMVNDVCAKMVFGGKKEMLYYQGLSGGEDDDINTGYDNTIWPYWGTDLDGNIVLGNYTGINHQFILDTRSINIPIVGPWYPTDVGELMASLAGFDTWCYYINLYSYNRYVFDPSGGGIDYLYDITTQVGFQSTFQQTNKSYTHSGILNPHFAKNYFLGLQSSLGTNIPSLLFGQTVTNVVNSLGKGGNMYNNPFSAPSQRSQLGELHSYLKSFAEEYYGKKFMVRVDNVYVAQDSDTGEYNYSALPVKSAWQEDYDIPTLQNYNLLPLDATAFTDAQGKIEVFVRFDEVGYYDFSDIPAGDLYWGAGGTSIFIKCEIDQNFVFLYNTARAIITLPGIVGIREPQYTSVLGPFLSLWLTPAQLNEALDKIATSPHGRDIAISKIPMAVIPYIAAIPLELQTELYGPWYIATAIGRTDVVYEDYLVPWNYGTTELMNLAGNAKVSEIGVKLQTLESGSVEYPGVPALQLGAQLLSVGPYITDIQVSISTGGITTRYMMKSWTPRFGKMAKFMADKINKIGKAQYELLRYIRQVERKKNGYI